MGNAHNVANSMTDTDTQSFVELSNSVFTAEEIKALWYHFMNITSNTEYIELQKFQAAMLFKDSAFLDRIFRVFDTNEDDKISFSEYITCLSFISNRSPKESKLKFSYQIYDYDGDGFISKLDLRAMLAATLREHGIVISSSDIDYVVEKTFVEANPVQENMISYEEYKTLVEKNPHMIAQLTINISSIISEYSGSNYVALSTPRGFESALKIHME